MMIRTVFASVALVVACKSNPSVFDDGAGGDVSMLSSKKLDPDNKDQPAPVTPAKLAPIISELGAENVNPSAIVVSFASPIIERDESGRVTSKSVLKIKPAVAGTLTYLGTSQLKFTPSAGFDSDTRYSIELEKVETRDGVIEPPGNTKWTHEFKTPAFRLMSWAPTGANLTMKNVTMELAFTAAVFANIARNAMTFTVDGAPVANVAVMPQRSNNLNPHLMTVSLSDPRIKVGAKLAVAMKETVTSVGGAKAPAVTFEHVLAKEPIVSIKGAQFVEGPSGYYLEVACDDKAANPGHRNSYYDGEYVSGLSERCQLSDESLQRISITPKVDKPYITSGKSGFRVFGNFKRGVYRVKIEPGARTIDGGTVMAPFSRSYAVAARKPQLSFAGTGRYLPRAAWTNLGIRHLNVDDANLIVRQIPVENLVFWLGNTASDVADDRTSNVILKETIPLRGDADTHTTSWKDIASMLPATTKGVIELKLAGGGTHSTARLLLTDLSLVAKKTSVPDEPWRQIVKVWALDMQTNELLDGVEMQLVRKSGKVVATCRTGGAAGCMLEVKPGDPDEAEPFAIIARKNNDLTYIRYQDLRADVAEASIAGRPYQQTSPYRAAMYADRGVYRPGDTAHVVAVLRDAKDRAPDKELPVDVKILDPKAKVVRKQSLKTNPAGVIVIDHALPPFADTGHWRITLEVGDKPLAAYDVQVEEFVPERMKVSIAAKQAENLSGSKLAFDIGATYLFGGSAMDSGVELICTVEPERFSPAENGDLVYGVPPKGKQAPLGDKVTGQLDPAGKTTLACDATTGFTQTMSVTARAAVLEAGSGRATVKSATATLHPDRHYIGMKTKMPVVASGKPFSVEGMLVDWKGKPVAQDGKLEVQLEHLEYDYGYSVDADTGEASYDRHMRHVPEGKLEVPITGGKFKFDVTPADADIGYVVRAKLGKAETALVLDGVYPYTYYSDYGDTDRVDQTPRPAKPTKLKLELPKAVEVGKPATVKARAPYKGKLLWTVETDRVLKSEWVDTQGGEVSWSFDLAKFAPNVYVSAFLIKDPHLESAKAFLPDRAFGVGSVRVTPVEFTHSLSIKAPKEVRSSSPLTITLETGPVTEPTFATVAVVDEGILSLTSFQTPDPNAQLFSKRSLGVETFETIGWTMLHQPAGSSSKTGGGDMGAMEESGPMDQGRVQPVKPVALFSGLLPVGSDGKLTVPFQIPSYRGQVRVMAFTQSATKIGRAEAQVIVRDPLVVQTTFPRFVTHDDDIMVPVFLTNVSGGPLEVSVKIESAHLPMPGIAVAKDAVAPLAFAGKDGTTIKIANGFAETVVFRAKAAVPIGAAKIKVTASAKGAFNGTVTDELEVPFLPAGPKDRTITKIQVQPGPLDLSAQPALRGWVPTSETTTFWLTSNPYGESFEHLKYLVNYPYGCVEQTTSSTRPLLYVAALAEQIDPKLAALKIEDMVLAGIARIFSMQTPAGGFGYWPGATEPEDWGTAYATHMLLDAKKLGYAVPEERLRSVIDWIDTRAAAYERGLGKYDRHAVAHYDGQVQAYLHYVLALAGRGKKARIVKLISEYPATAKGEQLEDLYMLKAAFYHAGDRRFAADLKTVDASPILPERSNYWSFYSDRRRRGMQLSIFFDLFKNDPAGEPLAQRVAQALVGQTSSYYTTQELVWGVTGLGKWVTAAASKGVAGGTLTADGIAIAARATKTKSNDKTWTLYRASEYKKVQLDIPQSAAGMWLVIRSEGVRQNATYKTGGNGMIVSRTYRQQDGTQIDPDGDDAIKLGDVLFVELELRNSSGAAINNIALVDRLPAGFEIENARLGRGLKVDWVKDDELWQVDFQNMRDDRVEAFGHLPATTTKKIVYTVRAVTSGKFTIPPVEAEAMYDPTLWARAAGGTAVVGGPWTGKTI
jgi:hypothetical protein